MTGPKRRPTCERRNISETIQYKANQCRPIHGRPVARGRGCDAPPQICQKVHFLPQSGLKIGFYEGGQVQKVHLMGFRTPPPPKTESGYGPDTRRSIFTYFFDTNLVKIERKMSAI